VFEKEATEVNRKEGETEGIETTADAWKEIQRGIALFEVQYRLFVDIDNKCKSIDENDRNKSEIASGFWTLAALVGLSLDPNDVSPGASAMKRGVRRIWKSIPWMQCFIEPDPCVLDLLPALYRLASNM